MRIEEHHIAYAKRHKDLEVGSHAVAHLPLLIEASSLEQMVLDKVMSLYDARRIFQDKYPQSKGIHCRCKKQWIDGWYKTRCNMVCRLSVISLIRKEDLFSDAII